MRLLLKPLQILYVIWAVSLFLLLMIPVFLWSLCVVGFGRIRGGNLIYRACTAWADIWFFLIGVPHRNYFEADVDKKESFIYVSNHVSYFDIPVIVKTFRHPVRPLGKAETAKVPVFGFIYRNAIVTVDRSSPGNRAQSVQLLKSTLKKGVSVLVFPEGTFNETGKPLKDFYDGAFRIAIETGTPVQPVLMLDTWSRMHPRSVLSLNPGRSRSVFLEPVPVEGYTLDDVAALRSEVYRRMEAALTRWNAPWIAQA